MSSNTTTKTFPSKKEILDEVKKTGQFNRAAQNLGFAETSLRRYAQKNGFWNDVIEARQKAQDERTVIKAEDPSNIEEVDLLKQRNSALESALKKTKKENVMEERIAQRLETVAQTVTPKYVPAAHVDDEEFDDHEFLLLFSDTHAGEVVDSEQTLGMNEYNWEIMLARMQKLQTSVLSYQRNRPYKISKLNVAMLGDMLSGDIHEELAITNEMPTEEAVVQFGYDASAWLEEFTPYFEKIHVVGVPGNHPRKTKKPSMKEAHNNSDWVSYKLIQALLQDHDNFTFDFPRSGYHTLTVADRWRMLLMHGDGIRTTMPGVPWGGVVRRVTVLEQQFAQAKQPLDYVALGHFHTANALDGVGTKTFMNGSLKGLDEYSLRQFGSGRHPTQLLLTFHPKNGVTDISYIDLEATSPNDPEYRI